MSGRVYSSLSCRCSPDSIAAYLDVEPVGAWRAATLEDALAVDAFDEHDTPFATFDAGTLPQMPTCAVCGEGFAAVNVKVWLLKDAALVAAAGGQYARGAWRGWLPPADVLVGDMTVSTRIAAPVSPATFAWRVSSSDDCGWRLPELLLSTTTPFLAQRDELIGLLWAHGRRAVDVLRDLERARGDVDLESRLAAASAALA